MSSPVTMEAIEQFSWDSVLSDVDKIMPVLHAVLAGHVKLSEAEKVEINK